MTPTISLRRGSLLSGGNKCIAHELVYLCPCTVPPYNGMCPSVGCVLEVSPYIHDVS